MSDTTEIERIVETVFSFGGLPKNERLAQATHDLNQLLLKARLNELDHAIKLIDGGFDCVCDIRLNQRKSQLKEAE